jgi:hypothetical protein
MRESKIKADDYPRGPDGMARLCADRLDELEGWKASARTKAERSTINKQMHSLRMLLAWCRTRAGYTGASGD